MSQNQINVNLGLPNSNEESTLKNDFDHSHNDSLDVITNEKKCLNTTANEMEVQYILNDSEKKENLSHVDSTLQNSVTNEVIDKSSESSSVNEHSYANINSENKSITETITSMDTLDKVTSKDHNDTNCNAEIDIDSLTTNNEVMVTEEIITLDIDNVNENCTDQEIEKNEKHINDESLNDQSNKDIFYIDTQSSLDKIALLYDSSDSEDDISKNPTTEENNKSKVEILNTKNYRGKNEVLVASDDSLDSESDSSSSDSESSSSDSSSVKSNKNDDSADDSEEEKKPKTRRNNRKKVFKPKGEFDDLPPIQDLKISVPEVLCDPLGEVAWFVEQMVVVRPKPGKPTLNLDTVLFIEKGQRALGHIFDVFGQVTDPHYCVRFNSSEHIQQSDIKIGMTVYYCPNTEHTSLVFLSELKKMKAVDDLEDEDPPQFSDDEEEQAYLASLKNKYNNNKKKDAASEVPNKRKCNNAGWQSNHPWNSNREQQNLHQPQRSSNPRPFYQTHHPWSRRRYQQPNPWNQYNAFPNNQWVAPTHPSYNEMQTYNYINPTQLQSVEMQNVQFPSVQWNPHYQMSPQINAVPLQGFPQTLIPPFNLAPPPPPPPPNADT